MRRRSFLQLNTLAASFLGVPKSSASLSASSARKRLAAIAASYTMHSSADNLITRILQGYWINDDFHPPACDVASLYLHHTGASDVGRRIAAAFGVQVTPSVSEALTLGTGKLAVDGVVLVGDEDHPGLDDKAPRSDERFSFFQQIVNVFRQSGRSVPVFCYGYLSTNWTEARQIHEWSRELGFPLMAGTSVPVTFRRPELDYHLPDNYDDRRLGDRAQPHYPLGVEFDGALVIAPGEETSDAMYAGLELLQSFVERRKGGETGIRSIEGLVGGEVWRSAQEGRWSKDLMTAALGRATHLGKGRPEDVEHPTAWLITYNDGTQGCVLSLSGLVSEYLAAFHIHGRREIDSTLCYTPVASRNDVSMLVQGISNLMLAGNSPYPIERNLLTSGAFAAVQSSAPRGSRRIETPMLKITYTAPERSFYARGRGW